MAKPKKATTTKTAPKRKTQVAPKWSLKSAPNRKTSKKVERVKNTSTLKASKAALTASPPKSTSRPLPAASSNAIARPNVRASSSKQSKVIEMLGTPNGVTIASITKETDWKPHSVRGFFAGVVRKKLKLDLQSAIKDGVRHYRIRPSAER
ncbi:MAG TPA: DUF3489 domain-containing protein [Afipia sp.]